MKILDLNALLTVIIFPYIILIFKLLMKPTEKRLDRIEKLIWRKIKWPENENQKSMEKSEHHTLKNVKAG